MKAQGQHSKSRGVPCITGSDFITTLPMFGWMDVNQDYLLCYLIQGDKWLIRFLQPSQKKGFKGCKGTSPAGPNSSSNSLIFMGVFMPLSQFPHSCWTREQPEATQLLAAPSEFEKQEEKRKKMKKKCLRGWTREDSGGGDSKEHHR